MNFEGIKDICREMTKAQPGRGVGEKRMDGENLILSARENLGTLVIYACLAGIVLDLQDSKP